MIINNHNKQFSVNMPIQSNIFKHFTPRNVIVGVIFMIISINIKLFILGLNITFSPEDGPSAEHYDPFPHITEEDINRVYREAKQKKIADITASIVR